MPVCIHCGNTLEEGAFFCPKCLQTQVAFPGVPPPRPIFAGEAPGPTTPERKTAVLVGPPPPPLSLGAVPPVVYRTPGASGAAPLPSTAAPVPPPPGWPAPPLPPLSPPPTPPPPEGMPVPAAVRDSGQRCRSCNSVISKMAVVCPVCAAPVQPPLRSAAATARGGPGDLAPTTPPVGGDAEGSEPR